MNTLPRLIPLIWLALATSAQAQFSTGLELMTREEYASIPTTAGYRAFLPPKVDLSQMFPPPGDQGNQSSCVAWAVAYGARSFYAASAGGRQPSERSAFSPAFVYNQLRNKSEGCNAGLNFISALRLIQSQGVATLSDFPYTDSNCSRLPSNQTKTVASVNKIDGWKTIGYRDIESVKGELYKRNPVIVGMNLPGSFHQVRGSQIFSDSRSNPEGPHAMVIVAYDDSKGAFKVINSWGKSWGDGGFGWISYPTMAELAAEYLVMEAPTVIPEPEPRPAPAPAPVPAPVPAPAPAPAPAPVPVPPSKVEIQSNVSEIIAQAECGKLKATVGNGGSVTLDGFIGDADRLRNLSERVRAVKGVTKVETRVRMAPWPQCEAYLTLEQLRAEPKVLSAQIPGNPSNILKKDDLVVFEIQMPKTTGFAYVSYLQTTGDAVPLLWGKSYTPKQTITLGKVGKRFRVSEPLGDELLVVITSPKVLFEDAMVGTNDRQFLSKLREKVMSLSDFERAEINVTLLPIKTVEK